MIPLKDNIPTSRFPVVTVALILINIAVFGWQLGSSTSLSAQTNHGLRALGLTPRDEKTIQYGAIPYRLTHPGRGCAIGVDTDNDDATPEADVVCQGTHDYSEAQGNGDPFVKLDQPPWWETVFTSMFMHGGFLHIAFNMLFLWIFGNNIEDWLGRGKFALFYLLAGVAAIFSQAVIDPASTVPTIGASGAIAGVLGAYALLYPRARVLTLIFIVFFVTVVELPALVMLLIWFALQFIPAVGQAASSGVSGGGVAYFVHVGGFLFGLALARLLLFRIPRPELRAT